MTAQQQRSIIKAMVPGRYKILCITKIKALLVNNKKCDDTDERNTCVNANFAISLTLLIKFFFLLS
jgi:hypothetical protein